MDILRAACTAIVLLTACQSSPRGTTPSTSGGGGGSADALFDALAVDGWKVEGWRPLVEGESLPTSLVIPSVGQQESVNLESLDCAGTGEQAECHCLWEAGSKATLKGQAAAKLAAALRAQHAPGCGADVCHVAIVYCVREPVDINSGPKPTTVDCAFKH